MNFTEDEINSLEWRSFEMLCFQFLTYLNKWSVKINNGGADQGVDILIKSKTTAKPIAVAQCKAYKKNKIGVKHIREFLGTMQIAGVKEGIYFTQSDYTEDARTIAKENKIKALKTSSLLKNLNKLPQAKQKEIKKLILSNPESATPTCVQCGVKMVKRTAGKGKNIGKPFWGCPNFPKCRCTLHY